MNFREIKEFYVNMDNIHCVYKSTQKPKGIGTGKDPTVYKIVFDF